MGAVLVIGGGAKSIGLYAAGPAAATGADRVGVSHARANLPEPLAFVADSGFPAARVTTLAADWEDAQ